MPPSCINISYYVHTHSSQISDADADELNSKTYDAEGERDRWSNTPY